VLKAENGSAQTLFPAQNLKFSNCKLVNAGKLKDFGNGVL
jgi:hypothetical protein